MITLSGFAHIRGKEKKRKERGPRKTVEGENYDTTLTRHFVLMARSMAAFATIATSEVVPRNKKKELVSTEDVGLPK